MVSKTFHGVSFLQKQVVRLSYMADMSYICSADGLTAFLMNHSTLLYMHHFHLNHLKLFVDIVVVACMAMCSWPALADDGHTLWLPHSIRSVTASVGSWRGNTTRGIADTEMRQSWQGGAYRLAVDSATLPREGFCVTLRHVRGADAGRLSACVTGGSNVGVLYGVYALLRWQACHTSAPDTTTVLRDRPRLKLRMLDHWDNPDGSVERGYAGRSIWKWEQIGQGTLSPYMEARLSIYARANASVGINAVVVNNVNASPVMLSRPYLKKLKTIADFLRPYGIRVFLSANFASPLALHATKTADPANATVQRWWREKCREIYRLIPDFGGFLVKANCEGQPGPGDYGRSHAEGANMLAEALQPFGGIVIWRSFVYGANHKNQDRVMQAVAEFKPLDGTFADNVILQSKNGPLDFQPREPYAPIFDNMAHTAQMAELQITQEYTGQSLHLVYLAPMWKEFFSQVDPVARHLSGIAGVANTGDDANWCGHPFSQANWYAFGRLAWDPGLTAEQIAQEWLAQTFGRGDSMATDALVDMMMGSRETCVDYMMPLGLHHIFAFDHHYGPQPDGYRADYPPEWCPVYYHKADSTGIGFDRTMATGSGATAQYSEPYRSMYEHVSTCPEKYLLWFHHLPWNYRMNNGRTLWQSLVDKYAEGVRHVDAYRALWRSPAIVSYVDAERWQQVNRLLNTQLANARLWQHTCLEYFKKQQSK